VLEAASVPPTTPKHAQLAEYGGNRNRRPTQPMPWTAASTTRKTILTEGRRLGEKGGKEKPARRRSDPVDVHHREGLAKKLRKAYPLKES